MRLPLLFLNPGRVAAPVAQQRKSRHHAGSPTRNPHVRSRLYRHRTHQRPHGRWHDVACAPTAGPTYGRV